MFNLFSKRSRVRYFIDSKEPAKTHFHGLCREVRQWEVPGLGVGVKLLSLGLGPKFHRVRDVGMTVWREQLVGWLTRTDVYLDYSILEKDAEDLIQRYGWERR